MRCDQFKRRLNQLLDRRLAPESDEPLRAHARCCSNCRELLELQHRVFAALTPSATTRGPIADSSSVPGRAVPPWITVRPGAAGRPAEVATQHTGSRRWAGWVLVAILLIALLPWQFGWERSTSTPLAVGPAGSAPAVQGSGIAAQTPRIRARRSDWLASWAIASPLSWGMVASRMELADREMWWKRWDASVTGPWWRPMQESLSPLTQSLASTVSVLRSAWPLARHAVIDRAPEGALHAPRSIGSAVHS